MRLLVSLAFLALLGGAGAAEDKPVAQAFYVAVNRPPKGFSESVARTPSTEVRLAVSLPGKSVVALDPAACKVAFTDDKGTDLSPPDRPLIDFPVVWTDNSLAQAAATIGTTKIPAEGATKLRLKGTLVFLCGSGKKTTDVELAIKKGEKVTAGPASFEVTEENKRLYVRVKAEEPLVKQILFSDKKQLLGGVTTYLTLNEMKKVNQLGMSTPPDNLQTVAFQVTHYEKLEAVKVEIDIEVGLGG